MIKISEMTDEELAMSYVSGNNKAFDLLLERNQSRLFSYILFIVHDRSMAEDLFQETFVKIISKLHEGKYSSSGKFVSWMLRIAHNAVMDWYRRQKNEKTMEVYNENDLYGDSTSVLDANIENHFVKEQVLRDVQRMSQEEGINLAGIRRILDLERRVEELEAHSAGSGGPADSADSPRS